jgi:hypothetical protein
LLLAIDDNMAGPTNLQDEVWNLTNT